MSQGYLRFHGYFVDCGKIGIPKEGLKVKKKNRYQKKIVNYCD